MIEKKKMWELDRYMGLDETVAIVEDGKVLVSGAYPSLHTNDVFMADMRKAREEYKKLSAAKNGKKVK